MREFSRDEWGILLDLVSWNTFLTIKRYTSSSGERRIRVHTAAAPVVSDLGEMYRLADTGAIISLFTRLGKFCYTFPVFGHLTFKPSPLVFLGLSRWSSCLSAIEKTLTSKLEEARNSVQLRIGKALREYRNLHAVQHRVAGKMIYPESLKYLPLYGLALCKSTALHGGFADAQLDERCAAGYTMMALPVKKLLKLLYPKLIRIDEYLLRVCIWQPFHIVAHYALKVLKPNNFLFLETIFTWGV